MILLKTLLLERFEQFSKLFLDPRNDDVPFEELLKVFKEEGGTISHGTFSMVFFHPHWNYVLKVFGQDTAYLQFIRFVLKNPRPSFPKLFDKPRRVLPHFKRTKSREFLYLVPLEKLEPVTSEEFTAIDFYLDRGDTDYSTAYDSEIWRQYKKTVEDIDRKYPKMKQFIKDYRFMQNTANIEGVEDLTRNNVMKRPSGEFIFADPFWVGESPYARHDRLMKAEMGDFPEYEKPEPEIKGGQRFKKPKPPKPVKHVPEPDEEVPF